MNQYVSPEPRGTVDLSQAPTALSRLEKVRLDPTLVPPRRSLWSRFIAWLRRPLTVRL